MSSIVYYLSCCGCFGMCCKPRYTKKYSKINRNGTLKELIPDRSAKRMASNPIRMKSDDMTVYHIIPKDFENTDQVLKSYGYECSFGEPLGSGLSGTVYKAKHTEKKIDVAIKVCRIPAADDPKKRKSALKSAKRELFACENIRHPHIIQMFVHFIVVENDMSSLYLMMQFAPEGDLNTFSKKNGPFNEETCKIWFAQLLSAMVYMHSKNIAHRDLKLPNILMNETHDLLISDFGLSQVLPNPDNGETFESTTYCGTVQYMPPEVLQKKDNRRFRGQAYDPFMVDVWSLGIVLYSLLNKSNPFSGLDKARAKVLKLMNKKKWKLNKAMINTPTPELEKLIKQMLEPIANKRPTMLQVTHEEWIAEVYQKVEKDCKKWFDEIKNKS